GRKAKPDAAGMQVVHGDFSLGSREMRAASRRAVEKADRFWFAPWRAKSQARCGWDARRARRFLAGVAGDASGTETTDLKSGQVLVRTLESEKPSQMRLGCKSCTAISCWGRGRCERHPDDRLKKRTGFGSHPGGRKAKPDAVGMQVVHGDFSLGSREMRAASRRPIERSEGRRFAPWRAKSQARCGWDASRAQRFLAGVAGDASGIQTGG